jgi:hypothetical protein
MKGEWKEKESLDCANILPSPKNGIVTAKADEDLMKFRRVNAFIFSQYCKINSVFVGSIASTKANRFPK